MTFAQVLLKDKDYIPYHWTGVYAGISAGAVKHTMNITDLQAVTFNATIQQVTNPSFTGGLQAGYRKQLNAAQASGVVGVEVNTNFANAKSAKIYGSPFAMYQLNSWHKLNNVSLIQLIAGIAADRTLLFFSTGLAWYDISGQVKNNDDIPFFNAFTVSQNDIAPSVGAGIEYALSDRVSLRLKLDFIAPNAYPTLDNSDNSYEISNNITQGTIGINYKFG